MNKHSHINHLGQAKTMLFNSLWWFVVAQPGINLMGELENILNKTTVISVQNAHG